MTGNVMFNVWKSVVSQLHCGPWRRRILSSKVGLYRSAASETVYLMRDLGVGKQSGQLPRGLCIFNDRLVRLHSPDEHRVGRARMTDKFTRLCKRQV